MSLSNVYSYTYTNINRYKRDQELTIIVDYLKENKIQEVATWFWLSGRIWSYSKGEIKSGHWLELNNDDIQPIYWLGDKKAYDYKEFTYVILDLNQEKILLNNKNSKIYTNKAKKLYETTNYRLYKFEENPLSEFRIPRKYETLEFPIAKVVKVFEQNGYTDNNKSILSKGNEGFVFFGPYIDIENGIYDIKVEYKINDNNEKKELGYIEVVSHNDTENMEDETKVVLLSKGKIAQNTSNVFLKNVKFKNRKNVEFRSYIYSGVKIEILQIQITKKK